MPIPAAHRSNGSPRHDPIRSQAGTSRFTAGPDNDLRLLNVSTAAVTRSSLRVTGHADERWR